MNQSIGRRRVAYALFSLACGVVTLWPFLTHAGVPAYQHDWSWSLDPVRFRDGLLQALSTWNEEGFGHANPFATANPVALFTVALGVVFPPRAGLLILLALISIVAGTGVIAVAEKIGANVPGALIATFLYVVSPVFFNKTSAGQLAYLEAYALFPWTAYWAVRGLKEGGYFNYIALAVFAGLECVQPQFLVFGMLLAILFALAFHNVRSSAVIATVAVAELLLNAPNLYAALTLQRGYGFTVPPPLHQFELLQSATWPQALRLIGYIIPYAASAYGRVPFGGASLAILWAAPALALAGLLYAIRKPAVQASLAIATVGLLLATGEHGPLAPYFAWGFVHVNATTLFREFYHAAVLVSFGFAVGTACAVTAIPRSAAPIAAAYALALLPLAAAGHSRDLRFLRVPVGQGEAISYIRTQPPGRVLALPYKVPLRVGSAASSGIDEFAYVDRSHMLATEYGSTPEMDAAAGLIADRHYVEARALLERFGVRYIVWRNWVRSAFPDSLLDRFQRAYLARAQAVFNPSFVANRRLVSNVRCFSNTCVGMLPLARGVVDAASNAVPLPWSWQTLLLRDSGLSQAATGASLHFQRRNISPHAGWVPAMDWRWANAMWEQLISPRAFTGAATSDAISFDSRGATATYVGGPLRICRIACSIAPRSAGIRKIASGAPARIYALGPAAVSSESPVSATGLILHPARINFTNAVPWRLRADVKGEGPTLVVFRTRSDRGWVLSGFPVLKRLIVDGEFNGWLIDAGRHGGVIDITYGPQNSFFTATWVEAAMYGVLLCSGLFMGVRRRAP